MSSNDSLGPVSSAKLFRSLESLVEITRRGFHRAAVLLVLQLAVASLSAFEYELEGRLVWRRHSDSPRVVAEEFREFKVFVRDDGWLIQATMDRGPGRTPTTWEVGSTNGREIFQVMYGS
jgi:hypothetical protein